MTDDELKALELSYEATIERAQQREEEAGKTPRYRAEERAWLHKRANDHYAQARDIRERIRAAVLDRQCPEDQDETSL
ncbi:hypothetical protein [Chromatium okenii]|nr:hypothetical protein [Chromatium okenii]MBV5308523.1 hypothetical protein [Chromatium okenii]